MPRVGRKNNPDYEQIDVKNKNGVSTKRYRKIKENKKEDKVEQVKAPVSPKKQKAPAKKAGKSAAQPKAPVGQQFTPNTDFEKPITNPQVAIKEDNTLLKYDVMEGLSQKELDRMERVKAKVSAIAKITSRKANRS
tara:strand:+ start:79 stop:486 length:408 start_codon:yes stop_codon:yes gene_type:complete